MKMNGFRSFGLLLLAFAWMGMVLVGAQTGCSNTDDPKKAECEHSGECEPNEKCVSKKCEPLGDVGAACKDRTDCLNAASDTKKPLVCAKGKCTEKCDTYLDCDHENGELCNNATGICSPGNKDAGPVKEGGGTTSQLGEQCGIGKNCAAGLDCVKLEGKTDGKCFKACTANKDCAAGRTCSGGHCVPYGTECEYDAQGKLRLPCWGKLGCEIESALKGKCYKPCTDGKECKTEDKLTCNEKKGKKHCTPAGDQAGPWQPCGANGKTCGAGYECAEKGVGSKEKICTKKCANDTECTWPRFCQTNLCFQGGNGTVKEGAACKPNATEDKDKCEAGRYCLAYEKAASGLCYRSCKDKRAKCENGTACKNIGNDSICVKSCTANTDCAAPTSVCAELKGISGKFCSHPNK